jgi:hypothetical protein
LSIVDFPALGFPATVTIPARFIGERYMRALREVPWVPRSQSSELDAQSPRRAELDEGFAMRCRQRPTLPRPLGRSTIGAAGLNDRVRNGNGCDPCALVTGKIGCLFWSARPLMRWSVGGRLMTTRRMRRGVRAPPERWCRKRRNEVVVECGRAMRGALHLGALLGSAP